MNKNTDTDKAVEILRGLLKGRSDSYELYFSLSNGVSVEAKDGLVDGLKVRSSAGVGLRTLKDAKQGFSFSSVFDEAALKDMVDSALLAGTAATPDALLSFASALNISKDKTQLKTFDEAIDSLSDVERIDIALSVESSAKNFDKRIKTVRKASFGSSEALRRTINSEGLDFTDNSTYFSSSVMVVAEDGGASETGWEAGMGHLRGDINAEEIGKAAAKEAVSMLGAKPIKTTKGPVVFKNTVVMELVGSLSTSLLGDNVIKGKSMLGGSVGSLVASEFINLIDDGTMTGGWASALADTEGVPMQRTPLITNGVLNGFLYDRYWAKRAKTKSTGNNVRGGFKGLGGLGTSNLYIEAGELSLDELFKELSDGLYLTELMGVHTMDPVSGDFSLGASGFVVKDGLLAEPFRGMAVSGNLIDLFKDVVRVGSDLRFLGSVGAPSLLVSELMASGE
ncbi:MAG: TldD/PmbA family protein [Deltaproteobacteria bacterium]|nr:TldD/PmbA family protein [Deltaproteobacteria bacterium]